MGDLTCRPHQLTPCCRFFEQPQEVKNEFPKVDWAAAKVIGYELNNLSGMQGRHHRTLWCYLVSLHLPAYELYRMYHVLPILNSALSLSCLVPGSRVVTPTV